MASKTAKKTGAKKTGRKPAIKKRQRIWGFFIGYAFSPGGFAVRVTPPYFKTDRRDLAEAIRKAKGIRELTPVQMEEYEHAQAVLDPELMRKRLRHAVEFDEVNRQAAELEAEAQAARANTAAQAAEQRAKEAADRVAELEANSAKDATTRTGDEGGEGSEVSEDSEGGEGDLFDDDGEKVPGISQEDLAEMSVDELAGVLELYSIPVPEPKTRAVLLTIAQEAVKGNIRVDDPEPEKGDGADA